jgi:D-aspartate ligase
MKKKFIIPALVLGSNKSGLGIIRALGTMGVPVVNISYDKYDIGYSSRYSSEKYFSPHPETDEKNFLNYLVDLGNKYHKGVLIPADDQSLSVVAKYKTELSEMFSVPVSEWKIIKMILKNNLTMETAQSAGIPAPRTFMPADLDQAEWFLEETGYPSILKAAEGYSILEIFKTSSIFIENYSQLKNVFTLAEKFERKVILQEYIPGGEGSEVNYSSYYFNSKPVLEFSSEKLRISASSHGFPRIMMSKYIPEVFDPSRRILEEFNYSGYSSIVFKKDTRNGIYKLLKVTARHNYTVPLAERCGINFPYNTYIHASRGIIPEECSSFKEGIYWIDPAADITESLRHHSRENLKMTNFIKPYLHKKILSVPSVKDPLPLLKSLMNRLRLKANIIFQSLLRKGGRMYLSH